MKRGATWSYVVNVYDPKTGTSKPTWVGGFETAEEAKTERDKARVKAREGNYVRRNRITVAAYLDDWIAVHAAEIKPRTLDSYRGVIDRYIVPHLGKMPLQDVRPATITRFYMELRSKGGRTGHGLSPRTIDYVHAVLRRAFRDAVVVEELLSNNPVERAKRPRREVHEPKAVWDKTQLRRFLAHAAEHRLGAFYHLAAYTGARRGELLYLRWSAVDLDKRELTIRGSTAFVKGERIQGSTKTGHSRVISIDQTTTQVLKRHRDMQDAERHQLGMGPTQADDFLFANEAGEQIHPDTVTWLMSKLITSYNAPAKDDPPAEPLPKARLHDLRHLHATMLLLAKVPVHVVSARLGHRDPAITLRVYAHVISDRAVNVADAFERVVEDNNAPEQQYR
ncbi:integrase [Streptomyces abyssalis]|uniref:Integrase n=1 Tax=Streptomyces abyssalis TaxID=933944 RepID=A0A1E7JRC1_9ACTN|nr:integrase [Streptomyces abyssalis]OEU95448.1 integrase [Streptomyces abyssalis]